MKISYNWLKDYLKCELTPQEIADAMTSIGIEVDSVEEQEEIPGGLEGVVVARVLTCEMHPDSDHLHITTVDDGSAEPVQVVCGAPNVAAGQKVLFARIGTVLPGDFKIKKSKIRGVESFGMICAEDELGIGTSHEGIMVLPEDSVPGTPAKEFLGLKTEAVIEYEITANRVDAASHWGVARDLYAYLVARDIPCALVRPEAPEKISGEGEAIPVEVLDGEGAPLYSGITVRGVKVGPSPEWLQKKLLSIGHNPINNVVDISNFILFELGQPLHTFDADKIGGGKVIVRRAAEGEHIITLDGADRTLRSTDVVIADTERAMCIAGVFGGNDSGVTEETVNVFIEGACFDPGAIRKTSKTQVLQTDASFRYERGADPAMAFYAARRAAALILETAGGKICGDMVEVVSRPVEKALIHVNYDRIESFIGKKIGHETIDKILKALQYEFVSGKDGDFVIAAPTYMVDVTRECDVVEEILRVYGYNNIELPVSMRVSVNPGASPEPEAVRNNISNFLAANGFNEVMNNSLTKEDYYTSLKTFPAEACARLVNPLSSDLNVMRQTLLLSGLEVIAYNLNRQIPSLRIFEYGSVYKRLPEKDGKTLDGYEEHQNFSILMTGASPKEWRRGQEKSDFFQLKGYVDLLLKRYRIDASLMETGAAPSDIFSEGVTYTLPGQGRLLATFGVINPALAKKFGIRQSVCAAEISWPVLFALIKRDKFSFKPLPRFPEVSRDLALLLDESVSYADLRKCALRSAKKLIREVSLFDVYRGDKIPAGKKQYAINFILQDPERTLTDADVEGAMGKILAAFQREFGAVLR